MPDRDNDLDLLERAGRAAGEIARKFYGGAYKRWNKPGGNPVSDAGSLVTFHYGYDLAELIHQWSGMNVEVSRFHDPSRGIIGEFTEVYWATKPEQQATRRSRWPTILRGLSKLRRAPSKLRAATLLRRASRRA